MRSFFVCITMLCILPCAGQSIDDLTALQDGRDKYKAMARYYMQKKQYNRSIAWYERFFDAGGSPDDLERSAVMIETRFEKLGSVTLPEYCIVSEPEQSLTADNVFSWMVWSVYGLKFNISHYRKSSTSTWIMGNVLSAREKYFKDIYDEKSYTRTAFYGASPRSMRGFSFLQLFDDTAEKEASAEGAIMWGLASGKYSQRKGGVVTISEGYALKFTMAVMNESITTIQLSYNYSNRAHEEFARKDAVAFLNSLVR